MVPLRAKATLSTLLLVVGALLVGDALNGGVVTGRFGITSPGFVLRVLIGGVAIAAGYQLRTPIEEYVTTPSDDPSTADPETGEGTSFDPELSPVGGAIEGAERAHERGETPERREAEENQSDNGDEERVGPPDVDAVDSRDDARSDG